MIARRATPASRLIPSTSCKRKASRRSLGQNHFRLVCVIVPEHPDTLHTRPCASRTGDPSAGVSLSSFQAADHAGTARFHPGPQPQLCINAGLTVA